MKRWEITFPDIDMLQNHGNKHTLVLAQEQIDKYAFGIEQRAQRHSHVWLLFALPDPVFILFYSCSKKLASLHCIIYTPLPCDSWLNLAIERHRREVGKKRREGRVMP